MVWSRNRPAIAKKNQAVARWAGVRATSPGRRKLSVACSRPCQPSRQRPNTANRIPIPPSSAISETTDQTTTLALGSLPTPGSGGQLLV